MKYKLRKAAAAAVIVAAVIYAVVFNIVRENSVNEAVPVMNTVYYGGDYIIAGDNDDKAVPETTVTAVTAITDIADTQIGFSTININTADIAALCELPGIGEVTAQAIIDYRNEHGEFTEIADIKNVKGIGEAKFEAIEAFITVGEIENETADPEPTETTTVEPETVAPEPSDPTASYTAVRGGPNTLINLNTASLDELMSISGIGEVTAGKIIDYRETYGFKTVEDLLHIDGIGEKKFDNIAPFVTV
jgi:competence protein ComEA